jgi:hypothetical protein
MVRAQLVQTLTASTQSFSLIMKRQTKHNFEYDRSSGSLMETWSVLIVAEQ